MGIGRGKKGEIKEGKGREKEGWEGAHPTNKKPLLHPCHTPFLRKQLKIYIVPSCNPCSSCAVTASF